MTFIGTAVELDPVTLTNEKIALLQERIPGLVILPGHPLYHLLEAQSSVDSENRQYLTEVPAEIFQTEGLTLWRVPVQAATPATAEATVTAVDTNGPYELPAGTEITLAGLGDERVGFVTRNQVIIPNGQSSTAVGEVELIAVVPGASGTGLQADPRFEETFSWVDTLTLTAATVGGQDGEDDGAYRARLSDRLQLAGDTLTHPVDYEIEARTNSPEVERALALDLYQPAKNETAELSHTATGGTFTLTVGANTTGALQWNSTAAQIKTALEGLASVGASNVLVTGGPLPALIRIEFIAGKAGTNLAVSGSGASLTGGGGAASFSLINVQDGAAAVPNTAGTCSLAVIDKDGLDPGQAVRDVGQARQRALSASGLVVTWITPTYTPITVVFAAKCFAGWDPTDVEARAEQAVLDLLSPAQWGVPAPVADENTPGEPQLWRNTPVVYFQDVSAVVNSVPGLERWTSLTVNGGTADVNLAGAAPLPSPAPATTVAGSVTAP